MGGSISSSDATEALELFAALTIDRHDTSHAWSRMWTLRHDITSYDAAYVALAEALGAPLVTADQKLARTAERYCEVLLVRA